MAHLLESGIAFSRAGGVNLALVKECLGHKAIGSTMKYVAVSDTQATVAAHAALMGLY